MIIMIIVIMIIIAMIIVIIMIVITITTIRFFYSWKLFKNIVLESYTIALTIGDP